MIEAAIQDPEYGPITCDACHKADVCAAFDCEAFECCLCSDCLRKGLAAIGEYVSGDANKSSEEK